MKYIDADKLIAEIRKLCSESCISESDEYYEYAKSEIIDIITSLQLKQPAADCHELEKHILEWTELEVEASFPEQDGDFISEQDYRDVIMQTARHFAEWGASHGKK